MKLHQLILLLLLGLLLVQYTLAEQAPGSASKGTAGKAPKETPKETPKEAPKAAPPKNDKTETPKSTPTAAKEASIVDTYLPIIQGYVNQAKDLATTYGAIAVDQAQVLAGHAAELTGEYSVVAGKYVSEYRKLLGDAAYKQSVDFVDRFLDPQHAIIVKKNYLNWYGAGIIFALVFALFQLTSQLSWLLSLTALRAFLSATSFGVYFSLAALYIITTVDPLSQVPVAVKTGPLAQLGLYVALATTALNLLSFVALPRRKASFVVLLLSVGLFVKELGLRKTLETYVGTIPVYTLETLVLLLQTILIFDNIYPRVTKEVTVEKEKKVAASSAKAQPTFIKTENIKKEKVKAK